MFNCCLMHLIGQSRSSDVNTRRPQWSEHLQQRFIYANRNGIWTSRRFRSLRRNVQNFQRARRRMFPWREPHQQMDHTRWPPPPPVRKQKEAQATFNPDSPNQVKKRSEKCGLVWWISIAETFRRGRAENVEYHPSIQSGVNASALFQLYLSFNANLYMLLLMRYWYVDSCTAQFRCSAVGAPQKWVCWRAEGHHHHVYFTEWYWNKWPGSHRNSQVSYFELGFSS